MDKKWITWIDKSGNRRRMVVGEPNAWFLNRALEMTERKLRSLTKGCDLEVELQAHKVELRKRIEVARAKESLYEPT